VWLTRGAERLDLVLRAIAASLSDGTATLIGYPSVGVG
jgi:hypothetical protein